MFMDGMNAVEYCRKCICLYETNPVLLIDSIYAVIVKSVFCLNETKLVLSRALVSHLSDMQRARDKWSSTGVTS